MKTLVLVEHDNTNMKDATLSAAVTLPFDAGACATSNEN